MTRTFKVIHNDFTIYENTCTINGNEVTGCINPFPYVNRKLRKLGLKAYKMDETDGNITLYVK